MEEDTPNQTEPEELSRNATECPICYSSYDNIFKTPLLLPCSHTFCMECLSRLCLFMKQSQDFPCPLCRTLAQIPTGGIPKMQPNLDIVALFPHDMQLLQDVWLEGRTLCWVRKVKSDQSKGSLVTVQLLPNQDNTGTEVLVSIPQPSFLIECRTFCGSIWGLGLAIFFLGVLLFAVVFLPIYLNHK